MRLLDGSDPAEHHDRRHHHHQKEDAIEDHLLAWVEGVEVLHSLVGEGVGQVVEALLLGEAEVLWTWVEVEAMLPLKGEGVEAQYEMGEVVVELLLPWLGVVGEHHVRGEGVVVVLLIDFWKELEVPCP